MQQSGSEQQATDPQQDETPPEATSSSPEQPFAETQPQQDCLDALRRSQADFINYKRRVAQEYAEVRVTAQEELLETLFPVLDDLSRALEAAPANLAEQPWVQGLHLIARRLTQTLQQMGIRQVGAPGEPFDPHWHEAVMMEPRADVPEGTVVQVTRPGYALGEHILRPAQVIVASAPEATAVASSEG